jgi:hypothetical protein
MMKRMACALALAAGTGLTLGVATRTALAQPHPATAASGLKLSVVPLGSVNADSPVALDVNFRGGKVRSVEVYLDGNRIAKENLDTVDTHGVISFKLPASLLAEGSHEILVQAIDKDGSTATTSTRLRVNPPAQESIARFLAPKRNSTVKEFSPIEVKLDEDVKDAYVMFFLDGTFLSARNYSPYVYTLDTSKYANGDHTVKIEVWDSTGMTRLKTLSLPLKINNYGGFTNNQKTTPDLGKPVKPSTPEAEATRVDAVAGAPIATLNPFSANGLSRSGANAGGSFGMRSGVEPHAGYTPVKATFIVPGHSVGSALNSDLTLLSPDNALARMPGGSTSGVRANGAIPTTKFSPTNSVADGHQARVAPQAYVAPAFPGILAEPADLNALSGETIGVARQSVGVRRPGNVAARPSLHLNGAVAPFVAHFTAPAATPTPVTVAHSGHVGRKVQIAQGPRVQVGSRTMHNTHIKTFDVAFDNTQIAFDVPPRIENGMPLAPFRAIFEHSGGTVKWYGASKTVRAINNSKEIEIHIGDTAATVNNQKVKLDAKAYIDRGRTIVPLSFVRDAMDVKVQYDAKTGHVLIESNK